MPFLVPTAERRLQNPGTVLGRFSGEGDRAPPLLTIGQDESRGPAQPQGRRGRAAFSERGREVGVNFRRQNLTNRHSDNNLSHKNYKREL